MKVIGVWPNTSRLLVKYLTDRTGLDVFSRRPADGWGPHVPCIFVDRLPGPPSDGFSKTYSFDIEAMAGTVADLGSLVQDLEVFMFTLPSESDTTAYVDDVQCTAEFAEFPLGDVAIERAVATFDITVRPQPAPTK
ncbi:hypothetical protein BRM3_08915 [Brachybacterium huguangmaarense]|uniref:Uncharacterized protein n=1 Tax=Brachybacterium huguangmaarense TaxID=1652028 RepID=A0ABY6FY52_9MICO|nr:hypothetical protein [Brachybacterium huguangmaarense]UYG15765.1 hypothetical protein BRM3_08915 [Brachybacterium huguangmaarense]